MTITNGQLNDTINRIEARVGKLESRMDTNDGDIKDVKREIKDIKDTVSKLLTSFNAAKIVLGAVGMVGTPLVTAIIVLIIQHIWGK